MKQTTHFIPCRFTYAQHPEQLTIGPVLLTPSSVFLERFRSHAEGLLNHEGGASVRPRFLEDVCAYYAAFTWTAQVTISENDPVESERRALWAARTAVNALRVLSDNRTMSRADVAGSRLHGLDTQAHITMSADGAIGFRHTQGSTAPVTFDEGWHSCLEDPEQAAFLKATAAALVHVVDPTKRHPIAERCIEALNFAGDAMSERHDAAQIAKAMIALERLLLFSRGSKNKKWTTHRAAAVQWWALEEIEYSQLIREGINYYQLRSDLFHGRISHFDDCVRANAAPCLRYVFDAIEAAMIWFNVCGVMTSSPANESMDAEFKRFCDEVRRTSGQRDEPA